MAERTETPACDCIHTVGLFAGSLLPQPWMQSPKHPPAVRCICGKQYYSLRVKQAFNSVVVIP